MPRVAPVSRAQASEDMLAHYDNMFGADRDPVDSPGTSTGTPGNWWTVWANVPGILKAFSAYPASQAPLDATLRELAVLRTGYAKGSQFVFSQHCKSARNVGVAPEKVEAVPYWTIADVFTPLERAILAYVDGLILEAGRVHDQVFAALRRELPDDQILMLTYFVNMYSLHATATKALRLEYDDVPERVVEIPVPSEGGVQDWRDPSWAERAAV
ncbi:MAG: carboxymuconolactone decarboxylase family protein [Alphaproteobacteria bacterium]|nr:carboxymuconolactone decarboxylase family protein [Alphaproteobacteria bacterium]MBU1514334.1 carboxymuconolactone decarboxylase family protein [Alphaproteobacteria bacterium]MBU2095978.1 carboxymuconolactone decarboxylase family protein [Alphaproteobacteria bacterium]MBU2153076.1 carboxymuconolactone decarboxylase family protein [Alphaproteobacteria bacterium]MBU2308533.1 carboxymuconolactone decarboxylase family protein [Alphaproteobacteria bacterium]